MKQIQLCKFCGDGLNNRGMAQDLGGESPLLIVRPDTSDDEVESLKALGVSIVYRYACSDISDYSKAMLGCSFFVRSLIRERKIVITPREYIASFWGIEENGSQTYKLLNGSWIIAYDKHVDLRVLQEFNRVKNGT